MHVPSPRSAGPTVLAAALAIAPAGPAAAQDFYAGRTLTLVAGTGAGGGHDIFARMVARHMGKYIPGKPTIVVQNMPGAGGTLATEWIATLAPKDGTAFGHVFPGAIVGPLLEEGSKLRYDPLKLAYIGSGDVDTRNCAVLKTSKIKTFKDLTMLPAPAVFGSSGPGGSTHDYAHMIANLAGAKVRVVTGYTGTPPITLAMERGEADGVCGWGWSIFKSEKTDWKTNNPFQFLVQMALKPDPELVALGVPDFYQFVSGDARKAAELIIAQQAFSRPYVAPPETPKERLAILREAFDRTLADKDLVAEFAKINIVNQPVSGAEVQRLVEKMYATPPEIVALARKAQMPAK